MCVISHLLQFIYVVVVVVLVLLLLSPPFLISNIPFFVCVNARAFSTIIRSSRLFSLSLSLALSISLSQRITRSNSVLCQLRVDSISDKINCIHNQIYHIFFAALVWNRNNSNQTTKQRQQHHNDIHQEWMRNRHNEREREKKITWFVTKRKRNYY